jgi:hypothetical protein
VPAVSASVGGGSSAGISASLGTTSSVLPAVSASVSTGAGGPAAVGASVTTSAIGSGAPPGSSVTVPQSSAAILSGSEGLAGVVDPVTGLDAGSAAVGDSPGHGTPGGATGTTLEARVTSQNAPAICSQLVFHPLVAGCQTLLGPISGNGLAPTGTPLLTGVVGVLLILVGGLTSRRSGRRRRIANGTDEAPRGRRSARADA